MGFGPSTVTLLTRTTSSAATRVPATKDDARNEIRFSDLLEAILRAAEESGNGPLRYNGTVINSTVSITGTSLTLTGNSTAAFFQGDGSLLTGIPTGNDASALTTGTLADARLSANVPLLTAATNAFAGNLTLGGNLTASFLVGNGGNLSGLNASNLTTGTISTARNHSSVVLSNATNNSFTGNLTIAGNIAAAFLSGDGGNLSAVPLESGVTTNLADGLVLASGFTVGVVACVTSGGDGQLTLGGPATDGRIEIVEGTGAFTSIDLDGANHTILTQIVDLGTSTLGNGSLVIRNNADAIVFSLDGSGTVVGVVPEVTNTSDSFVRTGNGAGGYSWTPVGDLGYISDISGQDLSTADNTTSGFLSNITGQDLSTADNTASGFQNATQVQALIDAGSYISSVDSGVGSDMVGVVFGVGGSLAANSTVTITAAGNLSLSAGCLTAPGAILTSTTATGIPLRIVGNATQTANIAQVELSNGAVRANMTGTGNLAVSGLRVNGQTTCGGSIVLDNGGNIFNPGTSGQYYAPVGSALFAANTFLLRWSASNVHAAGVDDSFFGRVSNGTLGNASTWIHSNGHNTQAANTSITSGANTALTDLRVSNIVPGNYTFRLTLFGNHSAPAEGLSVNFSASSNVTGTMFIGTAFYYSGGTLECTSPTIGFTSTFDGTVAAEEITLVIEGTIMANSTAGNLCPTVFIPGFATGNLTIYQGSTLELRRI